MTALEKFDITMYNKVIWKIMKLFCVFINNKYNYKSTIYLAVIEAFQISHRCVSMEYIWNNMFPLSSLSSYNLIIFGSFFCGILNFIILPPSPIWYDRSAACKFTDSS